MIYDILFYNNELDLLEIRINQHNDYIDKFIIIIGDKTFQGKEKNNNIKKLLTKLKIEKI